MTPIEKARQEQEQQSGGSPVKTAAKVAGALALAGGAVYGRGLLRRGFSKANASDVSGTLKTGVGALKGDIAGAKASLTNPGGLVDGVKKRFSRWNEKQLLPGQVDTSMKSANLAAHTHARLVELNAAVDKVVQFEKGPDGRFLAAKKQEEKPGMSTGAKVAAGATVAGLLGAGIVAGRGYLDGARGAGVFKAGASGLRRDAGNIGKTVRALRSGTPFGQTAIGRDVTRSGKRAIGNGDLITGYGSGAMVKGRAR